MPEQAPGPAHSDGGQSSAEIYKQMHPDAIDDVEKARVMAHASDAAETDGVRLRDAATDALLATKGDYVPKDGEPYDNQREAAADATILTAEAEDARKEADGQAEWAGKQYDEIQATRSSARKEDSAES